VGVYQKFSSIVENCRKKGNKIKTRNDTKVIKKGIEQKGA
jgi:hypothetical protein